MGCWSGSADRSATVHAPRDYRLSGRDSDPARFAGSAGARLGLGAAGGGAGSCFSCPVAVAGLGRGRIPVGLVVGVAAGPVAGGTGRGRSLDRRLDRLYPRPGGAQRPFRVLDGSGDARRAADSAACSSTLALVVVGRCRERRHSPARVATGITSRRPLGVRRAIEAAARFVESRRVRLRAVALRQRYRRHRQHPRSADAASPRSGRALSDGSLPPAGRRPLCPSASRQSLHRRPGRLGGRGGGRHHALAMGRVQPDRGRSPDVRFRLAHRLGCRAATP